ncbi:MAG: hypothetical protein LBM22_00070 [Endomicrobium sp.]|jgi:DNA polymerase-1|nr:hypothetical protein [Endomicrobium sp.]
MTVTNRKLFIILDGNLYIHRTYHALKPLHVQVGHYQVSAVYGFFKLIFKLLNMFKPDYFLICFDYPAKYFRHDIFQDYKSNRKPLENSLIDQMKIIRDGITALNIMQLEIKGYEADDLIATIVNQNSLYNIKIIVISGDKDILQLINDDRVKVWDDAKHIMYSTQEVKRKYGVTPRQLVDVLSLAGDIVDNIPGIYGIGLKTAIKLIQQFGTLENLFDNVNFVKGNLNKLLILGKYQAILSKRLIRLNTNVPLHFSLASCEKQNIDMKKAYPFFNKYKLNSFIIKYCL